jgi:hypothetical protein
MAKIKGHQKVVCKAHANDFLMPFYFCPTLFNLAQSRRFDPDVGVGILVDLDDTAFVVHHDELHMPELKGVQDLVEDRDCFGLCLDDTLRDICAF